GASAPRGKRLSGSRRCSRILRPVFASPAAGSLLIRLSHRRRKLLAQRHLLEASHIRRSTVSSERECRAVWGQGAEHQAIERTKRTHKGLRGGQRRRIVSLGESRSRTRQIPFGP